jgi:hypothetical protein
VRGMLVWGFTAGLLDRLFRFVGWERPWDRARVEELPPEVVRLAFRTYGRPAAPPPEIPE